MNIVKKEDLHISIGAIIIIMLLSAIPVFPQDQEVPSTKTGAIKGQVIDRDIKTPIADVTVEVIGTGCRTLTDSEGQFAFEEIPVGTHILEFSCRFYLSRRQTDVIVRSRRITNVRVELQLEDDRRETEEVTVTAGYFVADESQPTSAAGFSNEEIRRAAGAAGDISRIVSGLPGVARTNDTVNYLVVRGGSPSENAFYIDNIEVPNINHYPMQGSTAGAIGLLNVDFIRDVQFYSGGFLPYFGNRLSSVMDIAFREGNRDEHDFQLGLDMMGLSLVGEGPLAGKKGSWMFSARRSYLDLLIGLMGSGVPVTWSDYQGKLTFDLSPKNKLTVLGVLGVDDSGTEKADALKDKESFFGELDTVEHAVGMNWLRMWGANGYSSTSLSHNSIRYRDAYYHTVSEDLARKGSNREQSFSLRNVNTFRLNSINKFSFGLEVKRLIADYDYYVAASTDAVGNPVPETSRIVRARGDLLAAFLNHNWNPLRRLSLNLGARIDHFTYNSNTHISPRFSLSWGLTERTTFQAAAGVFYQPLPGLLLLQNEDRKKLRDPVAHHFVAGINHLLTDNTRLTVEVYDKEYDHLPLDPDQPSLFILDEIFYGGYFGEHERLSDTGRARSYGVEVLVQKKFARKLYGLLSGTFARSRYRDLDGLWRNRAYDGRFIFSAQGGFKPNPNWEFSLRWDWAGGMPFTPFDVEASQSAGSGVFDIAMINGRRLPDYQSLNIRADRRFYFRSSNLVLYISVWNVFNRKNTVSYYWNTIEQKPDSVNGWGILPVLGVEFEF